MERLDGSRVKCKSYQVLKLVLEVINGSHAEQYKHCDDYAIAISKYNPGNATIIDREMGYFKRMLIEVFGGL